MDFDLGSLVAPGQNTDTFDELITVTVFYEDDDPKFMRDYVGVEVTTDAEMVDGQPKLLYKTDDAFHGGGRLSAMGFAFGYMHGRRASIKRDDGRPYSMGIREVPKTQEY